MLQPHVKDTYTCKKNKVPGPKVSIKWRVYGRALGYQQDIYTIMIR